MRKAFLFFLMAAAVIAASAQKKPGDLVLVQGGSFKNVKSSYFGKSTLANSYIGKPIIIPSFYIGQYEVTQKEWVEVMGSNPSKFQGDDLPVETVTWYDCVEYCNKRSLKEGLQPYYNIDKNKRDQNNEVEVDDIKWIVAIDDEANGYRLPTEAEWEYAASGGQASRSYTYSGSNDVDKVAWYYKNSGDKELTGYWSWPVIEQNHNKTQRVGTKPPNELGLYDLAGNVREWCWNWFGASPSFGTGPTGSKEGRVWRGGGWLGGDFCCASTWRASYEASGRAPDQGFRVCRNK